MRIQSERLKPILGVVFIFIVCISMAVFTTDASGQDQSKPKTQTAPKVQATVEVGAQVVDTVGDHAAKFQETRDVPAGFFIQRWSLRPVVARKEVALHLSGGDRGTPSPGRAPDRVDSSTVVYRGNEYSGDELLPEPGV